MYPNTEPKPAGSYVRNVHPCNRGDDDGVVISSDAEGIEGSLYVRVGIGSTVYGPAKNWRPIETAPAWLELLAERRELGRSYVGAACTLDGRPAAISGRLEPFATVAEVPTGPGYSFAWETVARVMTTSGGGFRS